MEIGPWRLEVEAWNQEVGAMELGIGVRRLENGTRKARTRAGAPRDPAVEEALAPKTGEPEGPIY